MSSNSYYGVCPNCQEELECYSENRPHPYVSGTCAGCGFNYLTFGAYENLESLNNLRTDRLIDNSEEEVTEEQINRIVLKTLPYQNPEYSTIPDTIDSVWKFTYKEKEHTLLVKAKGLFLSNNNLSCFKDLNLDNMSFTKGAYYTQVLIIDGQEFVLTLSQLK